MQKLINFLYDSFNLNKLDKKVKKLMAIGIKFSFVLLLFSVFILSLYIEHKSPTYLYFLGSYIFKAASVFIIVFFIDAICFNKILNTINISKP